jgi:hypothetical protein
MEEINEWVAWQWANVKINKENLTLLKQTINITKEDMEKYRWVMFTHALNFLQEQASLKKINSITFFYELIVNEGFGNPWEPPFNIIYGTQ